MPDPLSVSSAAIREHLAEVLASETFRGSERSRALLEMLVDRTLRGEADGLKEYTLGVEALGRGDGFDPRVDPIVRAEVSRLRKRLDQFYSAERPDALLRIVLQKGRYVPQFESLPARPARDDMDRPKESPWPRILIRASWAALGVAAGALIAAVVLFNGRPRTSAATSLALNLDVELRSNGTLGSEVGPDVVVSPDGTRIVFVARGANHRGRLYVRKLDADASQATEVPGTDGARVPFFSPDGRWVGYWADGAIKKVALDGGSPVELARTIDLLGATWTASGDIVAVTDPSVLSRLPSSGGSVQSVLDVTRESASLGWPQALPDGEHVLVTWSSGATDRRVEVVSTRDGTRQPIVRGGAFARYVTAGGRGFLLYVNQGTLFGLPFDLDGLRTHGAAFPILSDVAFVSNFGYAQFDVSPTGVAVYRRDTDRRTLAWIDRDGTVTPLGLEPGRYIGPRVSPDGRRVAVGLIDGGVWRVLVADLETGRITRLDTAPYSGGVWSADGSGFFLGGPAGLAWLPLEGADGPQQLTEQGPVVPWSIAPDGRLAYHQMDGNTHLDLWTLPVRAGHAIKASGPPAPFLQTPAVETWPTSSPDGRWIAYGSNESGVFEVYVRPFPGPGPAVQISKGGGRIAAWARNGHELLYQTDDQRVMVVEYAIGRSGFVSHPPRPWTPVRLGASGVLPAFGLAPNGERIIALLPSSRPEDRSSPNHVTFMFNFFERLLRKQTGPPS